MKTRRKKINASPRTIYGRQSRPVVMAKGATIKTTGVRAKRDETKGAGKDAKNIFVDRTYTGINKGRNYPYAGAKRGGTSATQ